MPRSDLIKVLYTNLKSRETNITTGAEVIDIETYAEGVRVRLRVTIRGTGAGRRAVEVERQAA